MYLGIDMHGTLLGEDERVPAECVKPLIESLDALRSKLRIYLCTGNDLGFVNRKIQPELLERFDGYVLETGCVLSDKLSETVIVPEETVRRIKELQARLEERKLPQVYKFARRLATISLFTRYGLSPADFREVVQERVNELGFADFVHVVYSSVAVDVIPRGYDKHTGIKRVAGEDEIVAIADSMNDLHFLRRADYTFLPANASAEARRILAEEGREVRPLHEATRLQKHLTAQSDRPYTWGVIEILVWLRERV